MDISKPDLKFNGAFTLRRKTERIIFHHSATPGDVSASTIHQWHLGNGWKGIGYHYVIRTFGLIEVCRPENSIGSHSGSAGNSNGIGICVAGNFMIGKPTEEQFTACVDLCRDIFSRNGVLLIQGHNDVMQTACPGKNFPLEQIREELNKNVQYPPIKIAISGCKIGSPIQGFLYNGSAMAPVRQILNVINIPFSWDDKTNSIIIGFYKVSVMIVNGVGYVPVRELVAIIDRGVTWDPDTKTAIII